MTADLMAPFNATASEPTTRNRKRVVRSIYCLICMVWRLWLWSTDYVLDYRSLKSVLNSIGWTLNSTHLPSYQNFQGWFFPRRAQIFQREFVKNRPIARSNGIRGIKGENLSRCNIEPHTFWHVRVLISWTAPLFENAPAHSRLTMCWMFCLLSLYSFL